MKSEILRIVSDFPPRAVIEQVVTESVTTIRLEEFLQRNLNDTLMKRLEIHYDQLTRKLTRKSKTIVLTSRENNVFLLLLRVNKDELLPQTLLMDWIIISKDKRSLMDKYIYLLRDKLKMLATEKEINEKKILTIKTVIGLGYQLIISNETPEDGFEYQDSVSAKLQTIPTEVLPEAIAARYEEESPKNIKALLDELRRNFPFAYLETLTEQDKDHIINQHLNKVERARKLLTTLAFTRDGDVFTLDHPHLIFDFNNLQISYIDPAKATKPEDITQAEATLLEILLSSPCDALSNKCLFERQFPDAIGEVNDFNSIEVLIRRVRIKLIRILNPYVDSIKSDSSLENRDIMIPFIKNVRGKGYLFSLISVGDFLAFK